MLRCNRKTERVVFEEMLNAKHPECKNFKKGLPFFFNFVYSKYQYYIW